jgi:hypothetical protein
MIGNDSTPIYSSESGLTSKPEIGSAAEMSQQGLSRRSLMSRNNGNYTTTVFLGSEIVIETHLIDAGASWMPA